MAKIASFKLLKYISPIQRGTKITKLQMMNKT